MGYMPPRLCFVAPGSFELVGSALDVETESPMRNALSVALPVFVLAASLATGERLLAQTGEQAPRELISGRLHKNYGDHGGEAPFVLVDPKTRAVIYEVSGDSAVDLSEFDGQEVRLNGSVAPALEGAARRLNVVGVARGVADDGEVTPAQGQIVTESVPAGEVIYEDSGPYAAGPMSDGYVYEDGYGGPPGYAQAPLWGPFPLLGLYPPTPPQGTSFGNPHWYWVRAEYLSWWTSGMDLPPLVTTSPAGTDQSEAGVLGTNGVSVLFGGQEYHEDQRSGGRIRFGFWLDPMQRLGVEGEYFGLEQSEENFSATSNGGSPILARPFYNAVDFAEDSELVGFPGLVEGTVGVATRGDFEGAAVRLRWTYCCPQASCDMCDPCAACGPTGPGLNLIGGYRFYRLAEGVRITEELNSLNSAAPGTFDIFDSFDAKNEFHGGEIGMLMEWHGHRWFIEALSRVSFGVTEQTASIRGGTTTTVLGIVESADTGILAQRSNIGEYRREEFTAIPEIGITLGWHITPRLAATFGYTFIYWPNVVRPANMIDPEVNPNLFAPEVDPLVGPLKPQYAWNSSDFWAQGLSVGADYRW